MQLKDFQQQVDEQVEVHYEHLLNLVKCLQIKAINVFHTTIFKIGLQQYLRLAIVGMERDTLIKHKESAMICEESGKL
jgi:hypothetical protein